MKRFSLSAFLVMMIGMLFCASSFAQETKRPIFHSYRFDDGGIMQNISNNGKWAVAEQALTSDGLTSKPKLVNLETDEITDLIPSIDACDNCTAKDVTDDGTIVVGSFDGLPAYWSKSINDWEFLEVENLWLGGEVLAVTPDGKYGVGKLIGEKVPERNEDGSIKTQKHPITGAVEIVYTEEEWNFKATMWDLSTGKIVELEGLPELDMAHEYISASSFNAISPDGRYLLEAIAWFNPGQSAHCVYDRVEKTYKVIGFNEYEDRAWTPLYTGLDNVDDLSMSANGLWVCGAANTYSASYPFRYNVQTGGFEVLDGDNDTNFDLCVCDGEGNIFSATEVTGPLRELKMRKDGFWYDFRKIMTNVYGIDFDNYVGVDYTGTPYALSEDGTKLVCMSSVYDQSYVVEFDHPVIEECNKLNLLDLYTVTPASGISFSYLQQVEILFEYDVEVLGANTSIALKDETGKTVRNSLTFATASDNSKRVRVAFRSQQLDAGKKYYIVLPAGSICMKGDKSRVNEAIELEYTGREKKPIELVSAYPEAGSAVTKIDYSSSYVTLTMDVDVAVTDTASASIYRVEGDQEYYLGDLSFLVNKNQVALYPSGIQYMYVGSTYKIVIQKGSISDAAQGSRSDTNDEISIVYEGAYVREIEQTDRVLFSCDFQDLSGALIDLFMFYDGDNNTLSSEFAALAGWDLNSSWNLSVRDDGSSDACAMSVSSYTPAGKSDDWMVIPRLNIPDDMCVLSFDAQGYRSSKTDRLKVYVWACDEEFNVLSKDITERIKTEGELAFDEVLSPGASEQYLAGDWTSYTVSLEKYAGKNVYIAFLNDNEDQSAVFVDNVIVQRDLRYSIALITESSVVAKDEQEISGIFTVTSSLEKYNKVTLTLKNSDGTVIDEIEHAQDTEMAQGYNFRFDFKALPLLIGKRNDFTIEVGLVGANTLGSSVNISDEVNSSINDLVFETTKRVVLEEYTGEACPNCPRGILAIENIEKTVGDKCIPIGIHTYSGGDRYSTSDLISYSSYLNLVAAPSGRVNRGYISSPLYADEENQVEYFTGTETNKTWLDYIQEELVTPADADVSIAPVATNGLTGQLVVPVTVRYALDAANVNLNIFAVVLEDNLPGVQSNNLGNYEGAIYGDWGKGGKYEGASANIIFKDVARQCLTAFGGNQGLLPQNIEAGKDYTATITADFPQGVRRLANAKVVVMLLDANTDKVINAVCAPISDLVGIEGVNAESLIAVSASAGNVKVAAEGNVKAELYSVSGQLIGVAEGNGNVSMDANGYKGVAVVKVVTDNGTVAKKVVIK
ncbi:MAG: choice-of-anchor J domain-containing protein [Bacteroides sp.]|nr:choice-of-anchor J domain-containing protein [Roseburia sp.]MCM1346068.1 choice-of-anchor J domain-containing protein [Bacteroides sp.]MCM1421343.1 choice-of-anchor J domain-containing protein [Bacteroides sp.]